jgi:Protein of unknown function (DUF3300)
MARFSTVSRMETPSGRAIGSAPRDWRTILGCDRFRPNRFRAATTAIVALIGVSANALGAPAFAQDIVYPRPVPRSSQGGTEQLQDLLSESPGFSSEGLRAQDDPAGEDGYFSEAALADLVAPVALYPDQLLAQILVAATHPLDVVEAERVLDETETLTDDELSVMIAEQDWDPSVMVLMSGFPEVIRMMAGDLDWTDNLGQAMLIQDGDVLAAIQQRRREAYSAGNLVSNEAQRIEQRDDQILIEPTDPERIYVPYYDSSQVYSTRAAPAPVYATQQQSPLANPIVAGALAFGGALLVSEIFGGDDDNDDDDDDDWRGYWDRDDTIDWRDRQVYARPTRYESWRSERDRYWDRMNSRWRRDLERDERRIEARRDAVRWLEEDNARRDDRLEALRDREREARREARRLEDEQREQRAHDDRQRAERREDENRRSEIERRQDRERERRVEEERERRAEIERKQDREGEQRAKEERERRAEKERRQEREAEKARADRDRSSQADRSEKKSESATAQSGKSDSGAASKTRQDRNDQAEKVRSQEKAKSAARSEDRKAKASGGEAKKSSQAKAEKRAEKKERSGNDGKEKSRKKCRDGDKNCN